MANNRNKNNSLAPKLIEAPKSLSTNTEQEILALHNLSALKDTQISELSAVNAKLSSETYRLTSLISRIAAIIASANLPSKITWWWVLNNVKVIVQLIEDIIQAIRSK